MQSATADGLSLPEGQKQPAFRRSVVAGQRSQLLFKVLEAQVEIQRGSELVEQLAGRLDMRWRRRLQDFQGHELSLNTKDTKEKSFRRRPVQALPWMNEDQKWPRGV